MTSQTVNADHEETSNKLKWLLGLRVLIVTILMGVSIALKVGQDSSPGPLPTFYSLITLTYLLTILYGLLLKHVRALAIFAYCQLAVDIFLETSLVLVTGGLASPFTFLYLISIISASMILYRQGGITTASLSAILFGTAGGLQYYELIQTGPGVLESREAIYFLLINILAFFTVAILSSSLAEKLKRARKSLQEKETGLTELKAFHENIVQSISSGLLTADLGGNITSFNRAAQEITGLSWSEVRGKKYVEVIEWEGVQEFYKDLEQINQSHRYDVETKKKDGSRLLLGVTLSPLRDELDKVTGVVGTFQDLTKIRKLEEEVRKREKLATIGQMAADMAHEIRNPLASLSGSVQVLRNELTLSEENKHLMEIALKETERLDNIITQFLYYARPSPLNYKSCNLHRLLEETVQLLENSRDYNSSIEIRTDFGPTDVLTRVDPDQMKQVFWNLSINAVQAMSTGGLLNIVMRVKKEVSDEIVHHPPHGNVGQFKDNHSGQITEIVFEDNGGGIVMEHLDRIFDPFFTTKSNGSGLGLAIVYRIIVDHGGRIWAESLDKQGTRFIIHLPAEQTN